MQNKILFNPLTADDLFNFTEVLDAIGIEAFLNSIDAKTLQSARKDSSVFGTQIAMKACSVFLHNLSRARDPLYKFFAGCTRTADEGMVNPSDLRELPISQFIHLITEFFKLPDITDFFEEASKLLGAWTK